MPNPATLRRWAHAAAIDAVVTAICAELPRNRRDALRQHVLAGGLPGGYPRDVSSHDVVQAFNRAVNALIPLTGLREPPPRPPRA